VPWKALIDLIEPHYPKTSSKGGRPPYPLETLLRIHLMQQWYDRSDPAMEDALIEVPTMRRFAGIDLISDRIPDETTILTFRHLLERHDLGRQIYCFAEDFVYETGEGSPQGQRHGHEAGNNHRCHLDRGTHLHLTEGEARACRRH
jgi:IS5 family transposase